MGKHRIEGTEPVSLADGDAVVIDARGMATLTIITGSGATATYSRVDSRPPRTAGPAATASVVPAATTGTENGATVAATTKLAITVDWQFYRVSVAGGTCRIGLAGAG